MKHVPDMRKNLFLGTLLNKNRFAMTLEADKLMIRKNEVYLVNMSVMTVTPKVVVPKFSVNKKKPII